MARSHEAKSLSVADVLEQIWFSWKHHGPPPSEEELIVYSCNGLIVIYGNVIATRLHSDRDKCLPMRKNSGLVYIDSAYLLHSTTSALPLISIAMSMAKRENVIFGKQSHQFQADVGSR